VAGLRTSIGALALAAGFAAAISVGTAPGKGESHRLRGNPVAGKVVFVAPRNFCTSCHTLQDAGSKGRAGPDLDRTRPTYAKSVAVLTVGGKRSKRYPAGMPSYRNLLSAEQIRDVSAYVFRASRR
jgi:mono/diheme cytochrome c family protein